MPKQDQREALKRLIDGNDRFARGLRSVESFTTTSDRAALADGQKPFAVILSCADSRVPSETVFDQGLGSLFVVRVAGNIVAPSLVGSVEYAVEVLGAELVVVVGHSKCGAVKATLDVMAGKGGEVSENIRDIVDRIRPAVAPFPTDLDKAISANVEASVAHLRHGSRLLEDRVRSERVLIVGGVYSLETGRVAMLDSTTS